MRFFRCLFFLCLLILSLAVQAQSNKTNIVYLMADDLGFADLSPEFMPRSYRIFANKGTQIPFYTMQNCTPTRAALMTGKTPSELGITGVDSPPNYAGLAVEEVLLAEKLKSAGYATGLFGKWHLGLTPEKGPLNNGFDEFLGLVHGWVNYYGPKPDGTAYPDGTLGHDHHGAHDFQFNGLPLYTQSYSTFAIGRAAERFVRTRAEKKQPFFAYVPFNAPHGPHAAPRKYVEYYQRRFNVSDSELALLYEYEDTVLAVPFRADINVLVKNKLTKLLYYASVRALDDAVADIFQAVEDSGQLPNTFFMFASDNGAGTGSLGRHGNNAPFRGGKGTPYEGGHRVANFIVWEGVLDPGHDVGFNIWVGDLHQTFLGIAGVKDHDRSSQGNNVLTPLLAGADDFIRKHRGRHIMTHISKGQYGDKFKAVWAINNAGVKYIRRVEMDAKSQETITFSEELYDLGADPGERSNLVDVPVFSRMLDRMRAKYARYGGDAKLRQLKLIERGGWKSFTIPEQWGFPDRHFPEDSVLRSNVF